MELRVECLAGPSGELEPQVVWFGNRRVPVRAVVDRWYGASHRWWKVDTEEGRYVLRRNEDGGAWDLAAVVRD